MDTLVKQCQVINRVFESEYIYKSVVIVDDPSTMYHMETILQHQYYPVEAIREECMDSSIMRFREGHIRMLIMSCAVWQMLMDKHPEPLIEANVIFVTDPNATDIQHFKEPLEKTPARKYISLLM